MEKTIKVQAQEDKVHNILNEVSKQCDCYFSYPTKIVPHKEVIKVDSYSGDVFSFLNTIFEDSIQIRTFKNQIILGDIDFLSKTRFKFTGQKIIKFSGVILDSATQKPVPFASLAVKGSYLGTAANSDGVFEIKMPAICVSSELQISSLGYHNTSIPIEDFMKDSIVHLSKSDVSIQEVLVRGIGADILVEKVKDNLKTYYRVEPYCYNLFYREYVNKYKECISYSEAMFKGCSPNANVLVKDRLVLQKARIFNKPEADMKSDTLNLKLKGGIDAVMSLDIVNDIPDFLGEDCFYLYDYAISDIRLWNDELVYVVSFKPDVKGNESMFEGELYITFDSYVMQGAEFKYNDEMLINLKDVLVYKKKGSVRVKPLLYNYRVEYKDVGGKYHLNYVKGDLSVDAKRRKQIKYINYSSTFEMVVTDVDTVNIIKPKRKELFETSNIFSEYINYSDDTYWENINIILPEKEIMDAFEKSGFMMKEQE